MKHDAREDETMLKEHIGPEGINAVGVAGQGVLPTLHLLCSISFETNDGKKRGLVTWI